ncbi:MAG: 3'-5' exoribonuclease [Candidatus Tectomicrobia bacterium]|nr:3'-5' exoribonuclease [Candidatus Tectomicrobia bacterium]
MHWLTQFWNAVRSKNQTDKQTPLSDLNFCVIDLETTGLDPPPVCRIIEIGAMRVSQGEITDRFTTLVNPQRVIPDEVVLLTGITNEAVSQAPSLQETLPNFLTFIDHSVLVAYQADFDCSHLNYALRQLMKTTLKTTNICLYKLAMRLLKDLNSYDLEVVAGHLGFKAEDRHRASGDAETAAIMLIKFLDLLPEKGIVTLKDLTRFLKGFDLQKRGAHFSAPPSYY